MSGCRLACSVGVPAQAKPRLPISASQRCECIALFVNCIVQCHAGSWADWDNRERKKETTQRERVSTITHCGGVYACDDGAGPEEEQVIPMVSPIGWVWLLDDKHVRFTLSVLLMLAFG